MTARQISTRAGPKPREGVRRPLTRERILEAALRIVDTEGLDGLTMRKLGSALGVDPMAVYKHVGDKGAVLGGIPELLWSEVERTSQDGEDWRAELREMARSLRKLAHTHPNAYPLLLQVEVLPEATFRVFGSKLSSLVAAGFSQDLAARAVRAVASYGVGYGSVELSALFVDTDEEPTEISETERMMKLLSCVPRDLPAHLVEAACVICDCDLDAQFGFGLDLLISGLEGELQSLVGRLDT